MARLSWSTASMRPLLRFPAQFTFGNAPRNVLRGPKFSSTDLSLMKNLPIGGGMRFQIRAEIFNVFNTVNYGNPERIARRRGVRADYDRRGDAPGAARRKAALLRIGERTARCGYEHSLRAPERQWRSS